MSSSDHVRPHTSTKTVTPWWLPISLLAVTTASLTVPIFLLRRHRAHVLARPAPPRRTGHAPTLFLPARSRPASVSPSTLKDQEPPADDKFNAALYGAKALGIATLIVGVCSAATVWGLKSALGVKDTQEFAERMRHIIRTNMPVLSSRIHRPPENPPSLLTAGTDGADSQVVEWSWPAAEARIKEAFDEGGFWEWLQVVMRELDAEAEAEQTKRKLSDRTSRS